MKAVWAAWSYPYYHPVDQSKCLQIVLNSATMDFMFNEEVAL